MKIITTVDRRGKPRRYWLWALLPLALLALLGAGALSYLTHLGFRPGNPLAPPFGGLRQVYILILGVDSDSEPRRADTIMVAAVDLGQKRIGVISVPRDFRVVIPGHEQQKINAAYTLGGVDLMRRTVEGLIGVRCDYYVKVTSSALARLVDALGGVEVNVDKRMYYRDRAQGLFINLHPGLQRLNGEQAVGYVRYRHDRTGDLARIKRQHNFLRAVMREAFQPRNLARLPRLLRLFANTVETDLTLRDLEAIRALSQDLAPEQIRARTLPGTPVTIAGISYLEPDWEGMQRCVNETLLGTRPPVAIVNASEIPGVERTLVERLAAAGYEVTEVRFAAQAAPVSEITGGADYPEETAQIRGWLNCGKVVESNGQEVPGAAITVVVGTDYLGKESN